MTPKNDNLTIRQGEILRYIAENGPCSIYQVSAKVPGQHYANVHGIVTRKLKTGRLVQKVESEGVDGWVITPQGLIKAIDHGADPKKIRARTLELTDKGFTALLTRGEGPEGNFSASIVDLCDFAESVGAKEWPALTSRDVLLWLYIQMVVPLLKQEEDLKKQGYQNFQYVVVPEPPMSGPPREAAAKKFRRELREMRKLG